MSIAYQIWLKDKAGKRVALLDSVPSFDYTIVANGIGSFTLNVPYSHAKRSFLQKDYRVEIFRDYGSGFPTTPTFGGHIRYLETSQEVSGGVIEHNLVVRGISYEHLLRTRLMLPLGLLTGHYGWPAIEGLDETFAYEEHAGPIETIMKEIVSHNCVEWDIANDDRSIHGFQVEADKRKGQTAVYRDRFISVLEALQTLAKAGNLDFSVVGITNGYEFRVAEPTDRRAGSAKANPVLFRAEWGRVERLRYTHDGLDIANFIYVGGKAPESEETAEVSLANQKIVVADGTDASVYMRTETYVDSRGSEDFYDLLVRGAEALEDMRETTAWEFGLYDAMGQRWGLDWGVGDLVTVYYEGETHDCKVNGVKVTVDESGENIEVTDVSAWGEPLDFSGVGLYWLEA